MPRDEIEAHTDLDACSPPSRSTSAVIAALRYRGEEVQFGRVLSALCQQPAVARAFVTAVLEHIHEPSEQRQELLAVPDDIVCLGENIVRHRAGRRMTSSASDGRIDLTFASSSRPWRLHVELKLDAKLTEAQVKIYAKDAPVAAVVRRPETLAIEPMLNWLGAAGWPTLLSALRALPVPESERQAWELLLDVMVSDGDLLAVPANSEDALACAELLAASGDLVLDHASRLMAGRVGIPVARLRPLAKARVIRPRPGVPWAGLDLRFAGWSWYWIDFRGVYSPAPEVFLWFYPSTTRRAEKAAQTAVAALNAAGRSYQRMKNGYRWRSYERSLHNATTEEFVAWCKAEISALHRAGVYKDDPYLKVLHRL